MRRQERQHLESEVALLVDLLRQTPEDAVVDRVNLEDRLAEVREALASAGAPEPEATRFALTFSGEPVEGSHAIEAQFAGRAVALARATGWCAPRSTSSPPTSSWPRPSGSAGSSRPNFYDARGRVYLELADATPAEVERGMAMLRKLVG